MNLRSAFVYTVLRLLVFLVPFGLLMLLPIGRELYWLSAIFAALIGLSLSLLFLRRPLDDVSAGLAARRPAADPLRKDEDVEDAAADVVYGQAPLAPRDGIPSSGAAADALRADEPSDDRHSEDEPRA